MKLFLSRYCFVTPAFSLLVLLLQIVTFQSAFCRPNSESSEEDFSRSTPAHILVLPTSSPQADILNNGHTLLEESVAERIIQEDVMPQQENFTFAPFPAQAELSPGIAPSSPLPPSFPDVLNRKCPYGDDTSLNRCLRQILHDLRPHFATGIPQLSIPPMDPLHINNISFHHGNGGPVQIIATFSDINVRGLSTFNRSDFFVNTKSRLLDLDLTITEMKITGNYELSGKMFVFPIRGSGTFWLHLGGVGVKGHGELSPITLNNHRSLIVRKTDIDLDISSIKLHLTNLFNGNELLGTVINKFLNENAAEVFEEVRPQVGKQIGDMISTLSNRALSTIPPELFSSLSQVLISGDEVAE